MTAESRYNSGIANYRWTGRLALADGTGATSEWTFLSNHAHVMLVIAQDPEVRLRDVADRVGITVRAVPRIVSDLEEAGVLTRERNGRRNRYQLHTAIPLRHSIEKHRTVGELVGLILAPDGNSRK